MPDLSLKGLDVEMYRRMKMSAFQAGQTLREWVVDKLSAAVDLKRSGGMADARPRKGRAGRVVGVNSAGVEAPVTTAGSSPASATKVKKLTAEQYAALSRTDQQRAMREGRY
jgi:hypothetical protein